MKIFLDDVRMPQDKYQDGGWWIARNLEEFQAISNMFWGYITHISFDHDLGSEDFDGDTCLKFIEEKFAQENRKLKDCPELLVHSDNGPGRRKLELGIEAIYRRATLA